MRYQALAIVLLSARGLYCTASAYPIYDGDNDIADSVVVGRWHAADSTGKLDSIIIVRLFPDVPSNKEYAVTTYQPSGVQHDALHLTRLGGLLFADVLPAESDQRWNAVPLHGILFGREERNRLVLHWIDPTWLQKYAEGHPKEIAVDSVGYWAMFTDSTTKVRSFIAKRVTASVWSKDSIVLVRMAVPGTR